MGLRAPTLKCDSEIKKKHNHIHVAIHQRTWPLGLLKTCPVLYDHLSLNFTFFQSERVWTISVRVPLIFKLNHDFSLQLWTSQQLILLKTLWLPRSAAIEIISHPLCFRSFFFSLSPKSSMSEKPIFLFVLYSWCIFTNLEKFLYRTCTIWWSPTADHLR